MGLHASYRRPPPLPPPAVFAIFRSGLAPKVVRAPQADLSAAETKQLLEKGATVDRDGANTERVSGLGAGP